MRKKKIAIVLGGFSSERKVSLISGDVVFNFLNKDLYEPYKIFIDPTEWYYLDKNNKKHPVDKNDFSITLDSKVTFDAVFNALHGTPGEDGVLKNYFDLIGIKMTGCSAYQYAVTFNKRDCLAILNKYGVPTAKSVYYNKGDKLDSQKILDSVGLPCFVKPNKAGSSMGMSKVNKSEEFDAAIEKALIEDSEILIESFLDGMEVSIGVMKIKGKTTPFPMTEIISENDFFDFEAKYLGKSKEITPARVSDSLKEKIEQQAIRIYNLLGMNGFSRSEFIIVNDVPYFLEINTTPGLTETSLLPQQAEKLGISLPELLHLAIEEIV